MRYEIPSAPGILAAQPFRTIYMGWMLFRSLFIDAPVMSIAYLFYRPRPTWRWMDAMGTLMLYNLIDVIGRCKWPALSRNPSQAVDEASLKETSFTWIPAPPEHVIQSFAQHPKEKPLPRCAGYVWPKGADLSAVKGKVACILHGGGYYFFSAHEESPAADLPRDLLKKTSVKAALSVNYRVSDYGAFPAQLLDALACYNHLVTNMGARPEDVVLIGDSAGAHLANVLVRYLRDTKVLPLPGHLMLFSPWTVQTPSKPNHHLDFLNYELVSFGAHLYDQAPIEYASPCHPDLPATTELFQGWPRTYLHYGQVECLCEDSEELERRMLKSGVDVTAVEERDAPHDIFVLAWFGSREKRNAMWKKVAEWLA